MNIKNCQDVYKGLIVSTWEGAGNSATNPDILKNQPFVVYSFDGITKWIIKVITWGENGVPKWFEVRGKYLYIYFNKNLTSDEINVINSCISGNDTGFEYDLSFPTPNNYINENNVYKLVEECTFDFAQTVEIGECKCNKPEWFFSETIDNIENITEWQESGRKTFYSSGIWWVHAKLSCENKYDSKKFYIDVTKQETILL